MEVEGRHVLQQAGPVEVAKGGERRDLLRALDDRRPQPALVDDRHAERLHQRTRVLPEALLARHERVAVMEVFHLTLLQVAREPHVVVRREQQTRSFALQPFADRLDLRRLGDLIGGKVVEAEDHQRVRVGEDPLVDRQPVAGLIDALEDGDRESRSPRRRSAGSRSVERWKSSRVPAIPWRNCAALYSGVS